MVNVSQELRDKTVAALRYEGQLLRKRLARDKGPDRAIRLRWVEQVASREAVAQLIEDNQVDDRTLELLRMLRDYHRKMAAFPFMEHELLLVALLDQWPEPQP